jgi:hypothetical protein
MPSTKEEQADKKIHMRSTKPPAMQSVGITDCQLAMKGDWSWPDVDRLLDDEWDPDHNRTRILPSLLAAGFGFPWTVH